MERYKDFKPTSIQWLKEIPSHWQEKRIGALFTDDVLANTSYVFKHAFKFYYGTLIPKNEVGDIEEYREAYIKYSILKKNDIVINGLNLNYDFVSQRVAIAPTDGIITSAYLAIRPKSSTNAFYYHYVLKTIDNKKMLHGMGTGIRLTLSFSELKRQLLPFPPIPEQEKIVSYLDSKTSKIDAYVTEKERELQLLNELKDSEIANVVTKGLNPDVKMKDSGISWIGMIPEHWNLKRLKYVTSCNDENLTENHNPFETIEYVEIGDVSESEGIINSTKYLFKDSPSRARRITRKNDIIISTVRTYLKAIAQIERDGLIVSTGFAVLRPLTIDPLFLAYFTKCNGFTDEVLRYSIGISYPAITTSDLLRIKVTVPPISEQRAIVSYIEAKCAKINSLISDIEAEIEYLKEYKQRLIADCVTGQINVQNINN